MHTIGGQHSPKALPTRAAVDGWREKAWMK